MNDENGAERMAQLERALLRSLESLDRGDVDAARQELMRVAPATPPEPLAPRISDGELDAAFAEAEPERERMLDADSVAQAAIAEADRALAAEEDDASLAPGAPLSHEFSPSFATATMAELLEGQGDLEAASRIRAALAVVAKPARTVASEPAPALAARKSRDHIIRELETWLDNLRGGARA